MTHSVLIACEFSGIVRRAYRALGYEAWSCDLLPAEDGETFFHYQGSVLALLEGRPQWDLMIAHPPCTYLANSGVRWLKDNPQRWRDMRAAANFFNFLLNFAHIPKVAVENPVMHGHANIRKLDFTIQPWQFGHGETKRTCFWTRGLEPLKPTNIVDGREGRVFRAPPGPDRWKERSRTLQGIADAMADQWRPDR